MKKNILLIISILVVGIVLRLIGLDKQDGLWNDEYIAWWISSFDFGPELFKKILSNCHMPLYYLFLKVWTFLFGSADISLRLSSVFTGMLGIIFSYFLGKEYKDKNTGLICALFCALSGFLIYFSQEVRLYSLIFLISIWICYFFIKSVRNLNRINLFMFLFCNFLLLLTHTIGFVFVFFNLVIFSIIVVKQKPAFKPIIATTYMVTAILSLPLVPFVISILTRDVMSQNWGVFNLSKILFVFTDYFTPIQINISNSPISFFQFLKETGLLQSLIYIIVPLCISFYFVNKELKKNEPILRAMFSVSLLYFIVLVIAAISGKLVLSTKYSVEIYPVLILMFASCITCGINKITKNLAIIYFVILSVFLSFNPKAPQRLPRVEGHKAPVVLLNQAKITENDYIIALYHQIFRYEKYMDFVPKNVIELNKASVATYLMGMGNQEKDLKNKGKSKLRDAFLFKNENEINKRIDSIYTGIPKGKKVAIIVPVQVAFLSSNDLIRIASSDKEYNKAHIVFLAFSYAKIKLINAAFKYCDFVSMDERGTWIVLTFIKK